MMASSSCGSLFHCLALDLKISCLAQRLLSLEKIVALQLRVNNLNGNIPVSLDPEAFNLMT